MGKWMWTKLPIQASTAAAAGTQVTWNLPKSNFISLVHWKMWGTGNTETIAVDNSSARIMVIGNGDRMLYNTTGLENRFLDNHLNGTPPFVANLAGGYTAVDYIVYFGRCQYDKQVILPAKIFSTLQLILTLEAVAAANHWNASGCCFWGEVLQYVSDESPADKLCVKTTETEAGIPTAAAGFAYSQLPLGHKYKSLLFYCSGTDGAAVTDIRLEFNNASEIPFDRAWFMIQTYDFSVLDLHDPVGAITGGAHVPIAHWAFEEFDPGRGMMGGAEAGTIADCPDSGLLNDARLVFTLGQATQTINVVLQEYVSLA
jgi:hypothetical protein